MSATAMGSTPANGSSNIRCEGPVHSARAISAKTSDAAVGAMAKALLEKGAEIAKDNKVLGDISRESVVRTYKRGEFENAVLGAIESGASPEQLGRALAYAAALRITRFHTQNDFGDWDAVHHAFTYANALHQCLERHPSDELVRGVIHGALRVYLDRFLNVPAARLPVAEGADLADLQACWDGQGGVDQAGAIAYGWLKAGGDPRRLVAALGHALLSEDAGFHWFQIVEAAVRQHAAWPEGSSTPAEFKLPERVFVKPLARVLCESCGIGWVVVDQPIAVLALVGLAFLLFLACAPWLIPRLPIFRRDHAHGGRHRPAACRRR